MEPLDDRELNEILREWEAPGAPARLRRALFPTREAGPWWRSMWRAEIRIPVPLAVCLALLLAAGVWWSRPVPPPRITQSADVVTVRELRPVKELKPRIIRRAHDQN